MLLFIHQSSGHAHQRVTYLHTRTFPDSQIPVPDPLTTLPTFSPGPAGTLISGFVAASLIRGLDHTRCILVSLCCASTTPLWTIVEYLGLPCLAALPQMVLCHPPPGKTTPKTDRTSSTGTYQTRSPRPILPGTSPRTHPGIDYPRYESIGPPECVPDDDGDGENDASSSPMIMIARTTLTGPARPVTAANLPRSPFLVSSPGLQRHRSRRTLARTPTGRVQ